MHLKYNPHGGDVETIAKSFGLTSIPDVKWDFSININPLGPPIDVRRIMIMDHELVSKYPEAYAMKAISSLASAHGVPDNNVITGNGATEILGLILNALKPKGVSLIRPCYAGYEEACAVNSVPITDEYMCDPKLNFRLPDITSFKGDMLIMASPNNPTGQTYKREIILSLSAQHPDKIILVDESFIDFLPNADQYTFISSSMPTNVIVLKSLTKFFAIPGLRLGMACANSILIDRIRSAQLPWSANIIAQALIPQLYKNRNYLRMSKETTVSLRNNFISKLETLNHFQIFPSSVNFFLVRLLNNWTAPRLQKELLLRGILIRSCANYSGLTNTFCRFAVRPEPEISGLMDALSDIFKKQTDSPVLSPRRRTPAIMIVGTASYAGKSIVTAGLCRLFSRREISTAPFKAQNMSLNSYVTHEGGEMGRAQVVQAYASGIRPHTDMNPVLLKPMNNSTSQIIVNGKPIGQLSATDNSSIKKRMIFEAHAAYDRLSAKHDLIILEGAGSPAEINITDDYVNMDMAEYAGAKTILVADIDRGGVFASILGTIALLSRRHRKLLAGIIINKFRGDIALLKSGMDMIERMTDVPVLGVLPYIRDLKIEEEDSIVLDTERIIDCPVLDIAVIQLPHISNFTDYLEMSCDKGIQVRYVKTPAEIGSPDLIILPGTKNTCADLEWLKTTGIADIIVMKRNHGTPVFGICGGYQMLGISVADPHGIEGTSGKMNGLNMLPITTIMQPDKELSQVHGEILPTLRFINKPASFTGYEIHAGRTENEQHTNNCPLKISMRKNETTKEFAGTVSDDSLVFGCYIHGIFDSHIIRRALWNWLCRRNNISPELVSVKEISLISEIDRIADTIEKNIKHDAIL